MTGPGLFSFLKETHMPNGIAKSVNAATLETSKRTAAKSAAATIVTDMATAVALDTRAGFATAAQKAVLLEKAYGDLSANRLP